jgi:hypothetical protein
VSVGVNDVARAKAFYDPLMQLLGRRLRQADDESVDYGSDGLAFSLETPTDARPATLGNGVHIAFDALDRATVDAFYQEALRLAGAMPVPRGCGPNIAPSTTPHSFSTSMETRLKR